MVGGVSLEIPSTFYCDKAIDTQPYLISCSGGCPGPALSGYLGNLAVRIRLAESAIRNGPQSSLCTVRVCPRTLLLVCAGEVIESSMTVLLKVTRLSTSLGRRKLDILLIPTHSQTLLCIGTINTFDAENLATQSTVAQIGSGATCGGTSELGLDFLHPQPVSSHEGATTGRAHRVPCQYVNTHV
jgi:hypothetical protein